MAGPTEDLLDTVSLGEPPRRAFDLERFKAAVDQGADVDVRDDIGQSALLLVTIAHAYLSDVHPDKSKLLEAMRVLVERGANVNLATQLGLTPLMMAVHRAFTGSSEQGHPVPDIKSAYDILLSARNPAPDFNIRNFQGQTALHYLAARGQTDIIRKALAQGADISVRDANGVTVFMSAAGRNKALLELLLDLVPEGDRRGYLDQKTNAGSTALMLATRSAQPDVVDLLVDRYGVGLDARNLGNETARSIAVDGALVPRTPAPLKQRYEAIAQKLEKSGAPLPPAPPRRPSCNGANAEPFGFREIRSLIRRCGITRLDDLIPLLPVTHRSNYLLSYKTRGIQQGTFTHPRVITMAGDQSTILSFTGDPSLGGYDSLEMIEYKDRKGGKPARFELREISFERSRPRFSGKNPAVCLDCHGRTNPRPLWDPWYLWPGFYSSEQGARFPTEQKRFEEYLATARNTGRYRHLLEPSDSPARLREGLFNYADTIKNVRFETFVQDLNNEVIADRLSHEPRLAKLKYAVFGALSCQEPVDAFLPPEMNARMPRTPDQLLQETQALDVEEFRLRIARQQSIIPGSPEGDYGKSFVRGIQKNGSSQSTQTMARLRYVVEGAGVPMDWTLTFSEDRKNRYVQTGIARVDIKLWRSWLSDGDPEEAEIKRIYREAYERLPRNVADIVGMFRGPDFSPRIPNADSTELCSKLKALSLKRLGSGT